MELIDLIKQETHGGSMRYVISRKKYRSINSNVKKISIVNHKFEIEVMDNENIIN